MLKEFRNQGKMDGKIFNEKSYSKTGRNMITSWMSMRCIFNFLHSFYTKQVAISISFAPPQWTCFAVKGANFDE